jgi:hypothetical protein
VLPSRDPPLACLLGLRATVARAEPSEDENERGRPMSEQAAPPMPQPTAEHRSLKEHAGKWKVACKFYMEPGQPPMESNATESVEMVGDFWTLSKFENDMMGMPFVGSATMGFEPHSGEYVSTWIDSMAPALFVLRGKPKGDTIELRGKAWSCMTNSALEHRTTEKRISKDERLFEMFVTMPDGTEIKMMTNHYKRA